MLKTAVEKPREEIRLPRHTSVTSVEPARFFLAGAELLIFPHEEAVNHFVAGRMIDVFQTRSIAALAADSTHGFDQNANGGAGRFGNIYNKVDIFFMSHPQLLHSDLVLTNLDEIDHSSVIDPKLNLANGTPVESFAKNIKSDLGFVIGALGKRWRPLDPAAPEKYVQNFAGPGRLRYGFFGLGAGPDGAHIAYFGERNNIFDTTSRVELSPQEAQRRNATAAYSMGADTLSMMDHIYVTAKETRKSESLISGFLDVRSGESPQTGLGALLQYRPQRVHIVADNAAAEGIFRNAELKAALIKLD